MLLNNFSALDFWIKFGLSPFLWQVRLGLFCDMPMPSANVRYADISGRSGSRSRTPELCRFARTGSRVRRNLCHPMQSEPGTYLFSVFLQSIKLISGATRLIRCAKLVICLAVVLRDYGDSASLG